MTSKYIAILLAVSLTASAQDKNYFPKPSYFRETFAAPPVTKVELLSPVRLSDYVVAGKLELSLRAYLELVMANNTDIAISRLSVETAKNAILRGFSHSIRWPRRISTARAPSRCRPTLWPEPRRSSS